MSIASRLVPSPFRRIGTSQPRDTRTTAQKISGVPAPTTQSVMTGGSGRGRSGGSSASSSASQERARQQAEAQRLKEIEELRIKEEKAQAEAQRQAESQAREESKRQAEQEQRLTRQQLAVLTGQPVGSRVSEVFENVVVTRGQPEGQRRAQELRDSPVASAIGGLSFGQEKVLFEPIDKGIEALSRQGEIKIPSDISPKRTTIRVLPETERRPISVLATGLRETFLPTQQVALERRRKFVSTITSTSEELKNLYNINPVFAVSAGVGVVSGVVFEEVVSRPTRKLAQKAFPDAPKTLLDTTVPVEFRVVDRIEGTGFRQPSVPLPRQIDMEIRLGELSGKKPVETVIRQTGDTSVIFKKLDDTVFKITPIADDLARVEAFTPPTRATRSQPILIDTPFPDTAGLRQTRDITVRTPKKSDDFINVRAFEEQQISQVTQKPITVDQKIFQQRQIQAIQNVELTVGKQRFVGILDIKDTSKTVTRAGDIVTDIEDSLTIQRFGKPAKIETEILSRDIISPKPIVGDDFFTQTNQRLFRGEELKSIQITDDLSGQLIGRRQKQIAFLPDEVFFAQRVERTGTLRVVPKPPREFMSLGKRGQLSLDFEQRGLFKTRPVEKIDISRKTTFETSIKNISGLKDNTKILGLPRINVSDRLDDKSTFSLDSSLDLSSDISQDITIKQDIEPIFKIDTALAQQQIEDINMAQETQRSFDTGLRSRPLRLTKLKFTDPEKIKTPKSALFDLDKQKDRAEQGYNIFIRESGKFFKANQKVKNYAAAVNFGAKAVDNSAAATFKIKKTTKKAEVKEDFVDMFTLNKFRQPKSKKANKFIEKNKYRIDTQGEIKGISAKGWIANRRKKQFELKI